MEFSISALTQEIKMLSHNLGAFTRLFKLSIQQGMNSGVGISAEETKISIVKCPIRQRIPKLDIVTVTADPSNANKDYVELEL